jgi:hypothetical protein
VSIDATISPGARAVAGSAARETRHVSYTLPEQRGDAPRE